MMEKEEKLVSIKDTSDSRWLTVRGINTIHQIGLGQDGGLKSYLLYKDDSDADRDDDDDDEKEDSLCVNLFQISICDTGGVMISPTNKDLHCFINGEELVSEINLVSGSIIMIADKKLKIVDGPPIKERKKLPPTPGFVQSAAPPPKPHRNNQDESKYVLPLPPSSTITDNAELSDWHLVHSPIIDVEIIHNLETPEKLGSMAASFLSRQIHLYTDTKLSISATDEIFKFLQNVAVHQRSLLLTYLTEMSKSYEEMPESERDRPVHSPAIRLLVEILRQFLDPLSHVVLCLQMIRTFSHFHKNVIELVQCKSTPAILGCMAVYKDVEEVQEYGLDILAKIATYKNQLNEKLPIRETGVEMILRTIEHHHTNVDIVQPGCRTLTRLTSNIEETLHQLLDSEYQFCSEVEEAIETYEALLKHIFEQAIPIVQDALQQFPNNLSVSKEGRHFLFNSSKMTALKAKKKNRLVSSFSEKDEDNCSMDDSDSIYMPMADVFMKVDATENTKGILKTPDSFEIVENSQLHQDRKVRFVDDDNPDSYTSSDANSSDSDGERNIVPVLEIQETKILDKTDHLLPPLPPPPLSQQTS
ncbi:hypothetical protein KUTeg_020490 [Tegillarca granosa]|uniref:Uncharacterized protein n=1 Tax=Tegillarca granosa TaxID=220873 RepID=A0ABQ9E819_TEGGR|nr:hypothetical protein KUTeg_020490 [Tegillarca granosa]